MLRIIINIYTKKEGYRQNKQNNIYYNALHILAPPIYFVLNQYIIFMAVCQFMNDDFKKHLLAIILFVCKCRTQKRQKI